MSLWSVLKNLGIAGSRRRDPIVVEVEQSAVRSSEDRVFSKTESGTTRVRRAVGYCQSVQCEGFQEGVFLLNHGSQFWCPRCRESGSVENERGEVRGDLAIYREVRVEYNWDPDARIYRKLAVVWDESLDRKFSTYVLYSPLIKTQKRALKVAESILGNLNMSREAQEDLSIIPPMSEILLSWDVEGVDFKAGLAKWEARMKDSPMASLREYEQSAPISRLPKVADLMKVVGIGS